MHLKTNKKQTQHDNHNTFILRGCNSRKNLA